MTTPVKTSVLPGLQAADRELLGSLFALDTRSLAVFRIGTALLLLYDSWSGLLGARGALAASGEPIWDVLRIALLPAAVMLLTGTKTRIATIVCWLIYSHAIRTSLLTPGAPVPFESYVLTLSLFWGMFLPLGARVSVDARTASGKLPQGFLAVASAGLFIQVFLIYFSAGITKSFQEWVVEPTALFDILSNPRHGNVLGELLTRFPTVLAVLSILTIAVELVGPLLLFVPGKNLAMRRTVLVAVFVGFHLVLALLMDLGIFPLVMIVVWCAFLPYDVWTRESRGRLNLSSHVDTDRVRTIFATAALLLVVVSNIVTWTSFLPDSGPLAVIQNVARYLALYQQWTMYSVPSTL